MSDHDDILQRLIRIEATLYGDEAVRKAYDERDRNVAPQPPKPTPTLVEKVQELYDLIAPNLHFWRYQGLYGAIRELVGEESVRRRQQRTRAERLRGRANHLSLAMTGQPLSRWWRGRRRESQIDTLEEELKGKFGSLG